MAAKKRTPLERESDLVTIHQLRLQKLPPGEILARLNKQVVERTAVALAAAGHDPAHAAELAHASALGPKTLQRDFRQVLARLREGSRAGGELLVMQRIEELEIERQTLLLVEQRAWAEFERGDRQEKGRTERLEPVEIAVEGSDERQRVLRPREVVNRTESRGVNAGWLDRIIDCVKARVDIGREQFELALLLSSPPPLPVDLAELGARKDAAQQLLAREAEFLYRVEARASQRPVDQQRLRLVTAALQQRAGAPPRKSAADEDEGGMELTVRVIDIEGRTT